MTIRPGGAVDLEAVIRLERATAEAPHWAESEYAAMLVPASGAVRRCLFVAGELGVISFAVGKVIGIGSESSAELESVAVAASARRAGVGRALCAAVIDWCRAQGAQAIELEVRAASSGAIALYSGLGFVVEGRRPRYYREPMDDAVLMRLKLA
ncbi:MAG TPA: GNAT family N-acetyltransferase [Edaphobacter sp.]|nr:GNAT family N-acetyltransferase [Edaphobacter sp.]